MGEIPLRLDDRLRPLISIIKLIEVRLVEARERSSAALNEALSGERGVCVERLLDAEPALFEAQTLLQAAVILARNSGSVVTLPDEIHPIALDANGAA